MTNYEPVIGLEVHAQMRSRTKLFCGCPTDYGAPPNEQTCPVCLALPGALPVPNAKAIELAVQAGLALQCEVASHSVFARKNYFYPDLPKGYQISQFELPLNGRGHLDIEIDGGTKRIGITRIHVEEDAAKNIHGSGSSAVTLVDFNRGGTPLVEIVSEPDLRSAEEAEAYLRKLRDLLMFIGVNDGNLEEGSFRCDANVSVRPAGQQKLGTRTELKNLNSFRFVEKAINFEIARQIELLEDGGKVTQETRLYDSLRDETRPMRSKEEANDYRYFPDPDLLPVEIAADYIEHVRQTLPELPDAKKLRFTDQYGIRPDDAEILIVSRALADYFEMLAGETAATAQIAANWAIGELSAALNRDGLDIEQSRIPPAQLAGLLDRLTDQTISGKIAKEVFEAMWAGEGSADSIIDAKGLRQISDSSAIEAIVAKVIAAHPEQVAEYQSGKDKLIGFFVGQVMKESRGKANPEQVNEILRQKLQES